MLKKLNLSALMLFSLAGYSQGNIVDFGDDINLENDNKSVTEIEGGFQDKNLINKMSFDLRIVNLYVDSETKSEVSEGSGVSYSGEFENIDESVQDRFGIGIHKKVINYNDIGYKAGLVSQRLSFSQNNSDWGSDNLIFELSATYGVSEVAYLFGGFNIGYIFSAKAKADGTFNDLELDESDLESRFGYQFGVGFTPEGVNSNFAFTVSYLQYNQAIDYNEKIDGVDYSLEGDIRYSGLVLGGNFLF